MKPNDVNLYNKVKKKVMFKNPKHSAYRSGRIVSQYKKEISNPMKEKKDKGMVSKFDKDGLKEKIVRIEKPSVKGKKYTAIIKNISTGKERKISYGSKGYSQFNDSTPLKLYSSKDHGDEKRRQNYFSRHSGVKNKKEAIDKELKKSGGFYNAKILSHKYLW